MRAADALSLLDWKRAIFRLYEEARAEDDPVTAWEHWKQVRDELFRSHPQSALPASERAGFAGLSYFDYGPAFRVTAVLEDADAQTYEIPTSGEEPMVFERIGLLRFQLAGAETTLEAYWLKAYGGGLFVPFADATSGGSTYGAGRYLLDTVKGADLGATDAGLVLDFNFAYNPSCSYDPRWVCPLAPPRNRLQLPIEAGERL